MEKSKFIQRNLTTLQSIAKEMKEQGFNHVEFDTVKWGEVHINLFDTNGNERD